MTDVRESPHLGKAGQAVAEFLAAGPLHRDIYSLIDRARSAGPVAETITPDPAGGEPITQYYVFDHTLARQVLCDPGHFSNAAYVPGMRGTIGVAPTLLERDPPEHLRHRAMVAPLFRKPRVATWFGRLIDDAVTDLIDAFHDRGRLDMHQELTLALPIRVIGGIIGIPKGDMPFFSVNAARMIDIKLEWEEAHAARTALVAYLTHLIGMRRRHPGDGLVDDLLALVRDGQFTDKDVVSFLLFLVPAGVDTTDRAARNLFFALLTHPEQAAMVQTDRSLVPKALEETLRWESPVAGGPRIARADVDLGGVRIRAGSMVFVSLAAANRDPAQYRDPDVFDVRRDGPPHVGFGHGPHICVGMHLARLAIDVLVNAVFDRLPGLRFDPDRPQPYMYGKAFRLPNELRLVFDKS